MKTTLCPFYDLELVHGSGHKMLDQQQQRVFHDRRVFLGYNISACKFPRVCTQWHSLPREFVQVARECPAEAPTRSTTTTTTGCCTYVSHESHVKLNMTTPAKNTVFSWFIQCDAFSLPYLLTDELPAAIRVMYKSHQNHGNCQSGSRKSCKSTQHRPGHENQNIRIVNHTTHTNHTNNSSDINHTPQKITRMIQITPIIQAAVVQQTGFVVHEQLCRSRATGRGG